MNQPFLSEKQTEEIVAVSGAGGRLTHTADAVEGAAQGVQLWTARGEKPQSCTPELPSAILCPQGTHWDRGNGLSTAELMEEMSQCTRNGSGRAVWLCLSSCSPLGGTSSP